MTRNTKVLSLTGGALLLLAACGGNDLISAARLFGDDFQAAFAQNRNDTPKPSDELSITFDGEDGVSLTKDPVDI